MKVTQTEKSRQQGKARKSTMKKVLLGTLSLAVLALLSACPAMIGPCEPHPKGGCYLPADAPGCSTTKDRCPRGQICDPELHRCIDMLCTKNAECPNILVCRNGECVPEGVCP
jgi:hypothetical protein